MLYAKDTSLETHQKLFREIRKTINSMTLSATIFLIRIFPSVSEIMHIEIGTKISLLVTLLKLVARIYYYLQFHIDGREAFE